MLDAGGLGGKPSTERSRRVLLGWCIYIAFVVYGSLMPLDFQPLAFDQAWTRFSQIRWIQVGIEGRADWVANGVLYVPVGFLTVALFRVHQGLLRRSLMMLGAAAFCFALAVAVEFAQVCFPPRTVSHNDIMAEWIGSGLGIALAFHWGGWFHRLLAMRVGTNRQIIEHGLQAYAVCYVAFSFFPYDFVLSGGELASKLNSETWGWFLAGQSKDRGEAFLIVKLLAEILAVAPIGIMLGRRNEDCRMPATRHAWLVGGLLGLFIETIQFLLFSGIAQGASLLTRAAGVFAGAALWRERRRSNDLRQNPALRRSMWFLTPLYLLALLALHGWFDHTWHGLEAASQSLAATRFLPFYYHYYTSEQAALLSLVSVALIYAPLGAVAWLNWWSRPVAAWMAATVATGIEASKLFLTGLHADPTSVLIAALSAWGMVRFCESLGLKRIAPVASVENMIAPLGGVPKSQSDPAGLPVRAWWAIATTLGIVGWILVDFPVHSIALATVLLGYALLLWYRPFLLWAAIPAVLPLLDLAPWSGRFYLDEFDYLIMVSMVIGFARTTVAPKDSRWNAGATLIGVLLALTFTIGAIRGLLPWQWPEANSFSNYYSPYNALRLAKGALWAFLLLALLPRFRTDVRRLFASGMVVGLAGTVGIVLWERVAFPGLLNFIDVYRVTGPFSQMHTGGADIETFLTVAIPFALLVFVGAGSWWLRIAAGLVILGATYTLMVTFSRAGYVGYAVAVAIAIMFTAKSRLRGKVWRRMMPAAAVAAALAISVPVLSGSFAQERLARTAGDLKARMAHWQDTLAMRDLGLMTSLFGMGLGRFPEIHYWRSAEPRAGGYRLLREGDNAFLRLGAGLSLYIEQIIASEPATDYRLQFSIRSPRQGAAVTFSLCEKWLLTSGNCVFESVQVSQSGAAWEHHEIKLSSGNVGTLNGALPAPVKLSLYNVSGAGVVDIDNVQLNGPDGRPLVTNGDFARGMDRWFFSVDQDLPWHTWSMPVALLFDLGWFGLIGLACAGLYALTKYAHRASLGDAFASASLAALTGLLVLAGVDTVIDSPRLLFLVLLILLNSRSPAGHRSLSPQVR